MIAARVETPSVVHSRTSTWPDAELASRARDDVGLGIIGGVVATLCSRREHATAETPSTRARRETRMIHSSGVEGT
jgi:hypothetical protein